ncbi:TAXI family TRAP transporter solute-binding subunit [Noviherbaspirillum pedocola]|uniref:TAXI family TRAP transporter solute-binding subunit n=1 Tax=Noviherbaspirillum pedocola TaxID=2801341 RepID=A0A934STT6_9BURK|nr:TAXI family TRAP transporter solute-binding subunit [Noviherbaspirillum pedocola]MBK4735409.1 TAXI family TRAP transporter solute-binding subunit [Noviherbaspirillum pedocola]
MKLLSLLLALAMLLLSPLHAAAIDYKIVTASERGTYIQIGRDLAKYVAPAANIGLEVLPSKGSSENVQRLRYEPGVKLALVQSDVYQAFLDQAAAGNAQAGRMIKPLRAVMPLYNEEIYFVVRADSPLQYIHEIRDRKLAIGPVGSGTALSATTLYRLMFGKPLPEANATYISNEEALIRLTTDKSIDVAVIVAGQPAKLFVDMKPEARRYIKLLRLDNAAPETERALQTYYPAQIEKSSYPNWVDEPVPTLAVKAFLVTYDYGAAHGTADNLAAFAKSLCSNFDTLQEKGHAKWKEVKLDLPTLGKGWSYYPPMERALRSCLANRGQNDTRPMLNPASSGACTQQQKVLGLCGT